MWTSSQLWHVLFRRSATTVNLFCSPATPQCLHKKPWLSSLAHKTRHFSTLEENDLETEDGPLQRYDRSKFACPFSVFRTSSQNLPVYVLSKNNRSQKITVIRKVRGDTESLRKELQCLCRAPVRIVPGGSIEIYGHHRKAVLAYLRGLGY